MHVKLKYYEAVQSKCKYMRLTAFTVDTIAQASQESGIWHKKEKNKTFLSLTSGLHADETVLYNVYPAHSVFSPKR